VGAGVQDLGSRGSRAGMVLLCAGLALVCACMNACVQVRVCLSGCVRVFCLCGGGHAGVCARVWCCGFHCRESDEEGCR